MKRKNNLLVDIQGVTIKMKNCTICLTTQLSSFDTHPKEDEETAQKYFNDVILPKIDSYISSDIVITLLINTVGCNVSTKFFSLLRDVMLTHYQHKVDRIREGNNIHTQGVFSFEIHCHA